MADKEKADSNDGWENCKGQCGYTTFCSQCTRERDRLIREKQRAELLLRAGLYDEDE
ncbi:MAG TPA: hypothetical protein VFG29_00315 [Syntrophales bacterium]|nr:hypothetical protein [Syntrophales bacterium]